MNRNVIFAGSVLSLFILMGTCSYAVHDLTQQEVIADVTGKERIVETTGDTTESKYLIFTNMETFENTDSLWALKFNSSDLYGRLQEGQRCKFTVAGFRVSWASMYRNIINAECE